MESIKQQNTQYYAVGRNSGGRAQATHTYGARPMESRKLMAPAACIIEVASANTMAEDMARYGCQVPMVILRVILQISPFVKLYLPGAKVQVPVPGT